MASFGDIRDTARQLMCCILGNRPTEQQLTCTVAKLKGGYDYVTSKDVMKYTADIERTLLVFGEYEKSRAFRSLVQRFLEATKPSGSVDPPWMILHLLYSLSNKPSDGTLEHPVPELLTKADQINWPAVLKEPVADHFSESDSLSDWESDEETETVKSVQNVESQISKSLPLIAEANEKREPEHFFLEERIQTQYWKSQTSSRTDYQIIRETIWALQNPTGHSDLFLIQTGKVKSSFGLQLRSLASLSLTEYLNELCPLVESLQILENFLSQIRNAEWPLTYQAYGEALHKVRGNFFEFLSEVESEAEFLTLETFMNKLNPWESVIKSISDLHVIVFNSEIYPDNCSKALNLILKLCSRCEETQITDFCVLHPAFLEIFFSALRPCVDIIDRWLTHGRLEDPRQEFFIKKNLEISSATEMHWHESLTERQQVNLPPFLATVKDSLIMAGRSVEMLAKLGKIAHLTKESKKAKKSLYTELHEKFRCLSGKLEVPSESLTSEKPSKNLVLTLGCLGINEMENPLLKSAFEFVLESPEQINSSGEVLVEPSDEFLPFAACLEQSLSGLIKRKEKFACQTLLQVLWDNCHVKTHLENVRNVYLMRSGDLLEHFYSRLFSAMSSDDEWQLETTLTLSLQSCLAPRLKENSRLFAITWTTAPGTVTEVFENLQLNYSLAWPVTLILHKDCLQIYNELFRFLLKIKRSLWILQRLSFKDMLSAEELQSPSESLTGDLRVHRLQLLRSWLLHFIGSVDYYIMECVLEAAYGDLDQVLDKAPHLGVIIEEHERFVRLLQGRCFQHPSLSFLRDAILKVLDISVQVTQIWTTDFTSSLLCQLEESYVQSHQFVASILASTAANSILPNVGSLAAALIHSCPATDRTQNANFLS